MKKAFAATLLLLAALAGGCAAQAQTSPANLAPTEAAIRDQLACRQPPQAAIAIRAMLRNRMIRDTGEGADGSNVYAPVRRLAVFGFTIVSLTGWQADARGRPLPPFWRGPGTMPPNFFSVTVAARRDSVEAALVRLGLQDAVAIDPGGGEGTTLTCTRER